MRSLCFVGLLAHLSLTGCQTTPQTAPPSQPATPHDRAVVDDTIAPDVSADSAATDSATPVDPTTPELTTAVDDTVPPGQDDGTPSVTTTPDTTITTPAPTVETEVPAQASDPVEQDTPTEPVTSTTEQPTDEPVENHEPQPVEPSERTWTLGPSGSLVAVRVRYDRNTLIAGHDHYVQATRFSGQARWDPANVAACQISVDVPVTGLKVDPGNTRHRLGLEGSTKDKDKPTIQKNFLGKSQLWSSKYSTIKFRSTSCVTRGDKVHVTGKLTIRGITKRVTTPMKITVDGDRFQAKGALTIKHSDFGFSPFTAVLGGLRNEDALRFHLQFSGTP